MAEHPRYTTFRLGYQLFGVDVSNVQEVFTEHEATRVPLAPAAIGGLINLRGQVVITLDLRSRMGLPARAEGEAPMNVLVRHGEDVVSLLVDSIGDVIEVDPETFEPAPETIGGAAAEVIVGAYKLDTGLLLALDVGKVVALG